MYETVKYTICVILGYSRGFSRLKMLFSYTALPRTNFLVFDFGTIKNHIPKKWSQDAQVLEIKKNAMLFYCYELCNFSIQTYRKY